METLMSSYSIVDNRTTPSSGNTTPAVLDQPVCCKLLYNTICNSHVKIWDVMILVPNVLFLLFLIFKARRILVKLQKNDSPMFAVCLVLVCAANVISVLRCVISMVLSSNQDDVIDRAMWLILKFFLLATELSVIVFGFMFGHLDSRSSIHRVIAVTFTISLAYSLTQGALEFCSANETFHNITIDTGNTYNLYGHGGMMFWFISSLVLSVMYVAVCILPFTGLQDRFVIPVRKSFYVYCMLLAVLNIAQSVGCGVLHFRDLSFGWCIIDVTAYIYFIGFAPLIYCSFLRKFFASSVPVPVEISYHPQIDDIQPDDVDRMLPYPTPEYNRHLDVSINARLADDDDASRQRGDDDDIGAVGGTLPTLLNSYDVYVGVPDLKPSQRQHFSRSGTSTSPRDRRPRPAD